MLPDLLGQFISEQGRKRHDGNRGDDMLGFQFDVFSSYLFFPPRGRCATSLAAALLSTVVDLGSRRTLESAVSVLPQEQQRYGRGEPTMVDQGTGDPIYVLGYTEEELQRLMVQGRLFAEFTRHLFTDAEIGPGMRVLDIGCGVGDVSLLAADLVGTSGTVVGIDTDERSLGIARSRATAWGRSHITFQQSDLSDLAFDEPFDAVVGRLILMYLADPAEALRQVAEHVRPGGVLAFQEEHFEYTPLSGVHAPLFDRTRDWCTETLRRAGV